MVKDLTRRMENSELELLPEKSIIVCCKDYRRQESHMQVEFDFQVWSFVRIIKKSKMKRFSQTIFLLTFTLLVYSQEENRWFIEKKNGNFGFIDSLGNEVFSTKFDMLSENYSCGLVTFREGSKYGYLDLHGKIIFKTEKYFGEFSEDLLSVEENGRFYYLNTLGEKALELSKLKTPKEKVIIRAFNFHSGLALVELKSNSSDELLYGYIDKNGKWFIEPVFQHATSFVEGVAYVVKENKNYFMNIKGDLIVQLNEKDEIWQEGESDLFDYSEGFALINVSDSVTFIDNKGKRISCRMFRRAFKFSDNMAAVQLNDKWGFCDTTGKIVIQPQYYVPSDFSEGLAPVSLVVKENGYMFNSYFIQGFIDKTGKTVIPFEANVSYGGFKNGLTKGRRFIYENKKYTGKYELFYMRKDGKKVWSEIVKQ